MIIPCIKNKCITYPICMNKEYIKCPELRKYYWEMRETHSIGYTWKELFRQLRGVCTVNIGLARNLTIRDPELSTTPEKIQEEINKDRII